MCIRDSLNEALHIEGHRQIIETIRNLIRRGADVNFKNSLNIQRIFMKIIGNLKMKLIPQLS